MNDHAVVARVDRVSRLFEVRGERVLALDEVTADVPRGRLLAIAGPSGSGKSTLLAELGALDRPTTGTVTIGDRDITALGRRARRSIRRTQVATVLPQPSDNLLVRRTGVHNLRVAMRQRGGMASWVQRVIDDVDIGDFVDRMAGTMSGGEQQRLALACALVGGTPLVLADEPTGALDDVSAGHVIDALVRAVSFGATIVVATHDPAVMDACHQVVRLDHGRRVE
ncbi:MAG: ATP-binding cassette domain-containing protein [Actinobacteria bacterium]|nr:ATP-binding cassette domain-containing protein [Actinomycetota bacterium]